MKNALSVDVEDYFQVTGFEHVVDRARWDEYPVRFQIGLGRILQILDRHDVRATFFFLGWIAERYPEAVADVARRGHEVAIHGYAHRLVHRQRPEEFAEDLGRALAAVRKAYAGPILGYRAPTFSIRADTLWALGIIRDFGFRYDSSILPGRNGIADAQGLPHEIVDGLLEFPLSTVPVFGGRLRVAGGGYLRYEITQQCVHPIGHARRGARHHQRGAVRENRPRHPIDSDAGCRRRACAHDSCFARPARRRSSRPCGMAASGRRRKRSWRTSWAR